MCVHRMRICVLWKQRSGLGGDGTLSPCPSFPSLTTSAYRTQNSWIADSFNINTFAFSFTFCIVRPHTLACRWMIVSSMVQLGMSWWQAWICVWIGYGFVAPFIVLNARPGAIFHVTFPVVARTSFGIFGSLWCVFNRGAMAW